LRTSINGGTSPFEIEWSNGELGETAIIQQDGKYIVVITDANQCVTTDSIEIFQLLFHTEKGDNYCYQGNKGWIKSNAESGVPPYQYSIAPEPFSTVAEFNDLKSDIYVVAVQDASACIIADTIVILEKRSAPYKILLLPGDTTVELGQKLSFELLTNFLTEEENVFWNASFPLDCSDGFNPNGKPENDGVVQVWAEDIYGCPDTVQMRVQVDKNYYFYAPNIFWPENAQQEPNRTWSVFLKEEQVEKVLYLRVFGRWGQMLFERQDYLPGDIISFWDGTLEDKPMEAGVYVWQARVRFIDGVEKEYGGDVTLWRDGER